MDFSRASGTARERFANPSVLFALAFFFIVILRRAWLSDEAYISLRVVENLVNGYGLTWNTSQHALVFPHPLWVLLLGIGRLVSGEVYFTTLILSLALSLAAAVLVALAARTHLQSAGGLVVLALSGAFVDYSTSGLENPLVHLLLAAFLMVYFHHPVGIRRLSGLFLLTGLLALCRLELVLITLPMLALAWVETPGSRAQRALSAAPGVLSYAAWGVFAWVYYGSPLPLKAISVLHAGLPFEQLIGQGAASLALSLTRDPLTLVVVAGSVAAGYASRQPQVQRAASGILLYGLFVLASGANALGGQLLSAAVLVAVIFFCRVEYAPGRAVWVACVLTGLVIAGLLAPIPTLRIETDPQPARNGIIDARSEMFAATGLMHANRLTVMPNSPDRVNGLLMRASVAPNQPVVSTRQNIGIFGYYCGPETLLIDPFGRTDAFLAHLPGEWRNTPRAGLFTRSLPTGYLASAANDKNLITDPALANLYERVER